MSSTDAFLLDNNGVEVHTWASTYNPGKASFMTEDGHLYRTISDNSWPASPIGGSGGGVELFSYDGVLLNTFLHGSNTFLQHHDISILPNGNFLMISWEKIMRSEIIAAGRDSAITGQFMWSEKIIEVDINSGAHVWEWSVFDHMVQDRDPSLPNYGIIADSQSLLDINQPPVLPGLNDWLHFNAMDYNATLDQIVFSSRTLSEVFVIDHNISTADAAGPAGDFLYRFGNPENYDRGTSADRVFFNQHDIQWITEGRPGAGNMLVFNNGDPALRPYSTVDEFIPPFDPVTSTYSLGTFGAFGPSSMTWTYSPTPIFFGGFISGCERQPNGNTLICNGPAGELFEVDSAGTTAWNWTNTSSTMPAIFKVRRYQTSLFRDKKEFHALSGDSVNFNLAAGSMNAGRNYALVGTMSGISPGTTIGGLDIPINPDAFTAKTRSAVFSSYFLDFQGSLDSEGNATAQLIAGPIPSSFVGRTMHFAYVLLSPLDYSSNATPVEIVF